MKSRPKVTAFSKSLRFISSRSSTVVAYFVSSLTVFSVRPNNRPMLATAPHEKSISGSTAGPSSVGSCRSGSSHFFWRRWTDYLTNSGLLPSMSSSYLALMTSTPFLDIADLLSRDALGIFTSLKTGNSQKKPIK